jgi:hypothetical protein
MVPKSVPGQFRQEAMVLVSILTIVRENEVRGNRQLQVLENRFHFAANEWHESVLEILEQWALDRSRTGKQLGCALCLNGPGTDSTEHDPVEHTAWILLG